MSHKKQNQKSQNNNNSFDVKQRKKHKQKNNYHSSDKKSNAANKFEDDAIIDEHEDGDTPHFRMLSCCLYLIKFLLIMPCQKIFASLKQSVSSCWQFLLGCCKSKDDNREQYPYQRLPAGVAIDIDHESRLKTDYEEKMQKVEKEKNVAIFEMNQYKDKLASKEIEKNELQLQHKNQIQMLENEKKIALYRFQEQKKKEIQSIESERAIAMSRLEEQQKEIKSLQREKADAFKRLQEQQQREQSLLNEKTAVLSRLDEVKSELASLQNKNDTLQKEKDDALTRLSELMGTKLRDNNPAITNLNDPNRPMKLGDKFSELYENEWTDAYSELMDSRDLNITERDTISILLNILKEIYETCLEDIDEQLSGYKGQSDDDIRAAKDSMKTSGSKYIPLLYKKIMSNGSSCKTVVQYKEYSLPYIERCVEICYYALIQDPPMVIDFNTPKIFDKNLYKEYTRSGTTVEYLVWPVLYLHRNGPILSKGVVQPEK